ncbi:acetyltransferase [Neisseria wadsworthii]|uniref:Pilin glycosylation protein PglB n=1 Tax=Neisseria wadsworthii 9715 TaxID=1030841 RepID=G4CTG0_9NEIS|nr:acetyltransferase [Neisseria wadsworthii]EGZ44205.1 pilin glycosylation protein PglB [Neisseria wadsworthii 9715]QMT35946.1 acetyltransferase [Neisseria wadsworthii]
MTDISASSPQKKLVILGAGGHAKVVMDTALLMQKWSEIVFVDDFNNGEIEFMGVPLLGDSSLLGKSIHPDEYNAVVAIGDNIVRGRMFNLVKNLGFTLPCLCHPSAVISKFAEIGEGSVFFAQAVVNADAKIGKGAIINTTASVDHDSVLGDFVHISPGARLAGNTQVGNFSWMGIGSCTREGSTIGNHCIVGAGAVVLGNLPDETTAIGVPAKALNDKK